MKGMAKYLGRTIAAAALLCAGAACTDDPDAAGGAAVCTEAEPVRFEVACTPVCSAAQAATRAVPEEREWQEGDRIHIYAEFTAAAGKVIAEKDRKQYCCYKYENGDWVPSSTPTDVMMWPVGVQSGKFTAYYIEGLTERISENMSSDEKLLGDIAEGGDPLRCITGVQYGCSVSLNFEHLCTHLTLQKVKSDISEGYWLYCKNQGNGAMQVEQEFPNAYKLSYSPANGLTFEFCRSDKSRTTDGENGHYCIERRRNADGTVDFYLAQEPEGDGLKYAYGNCELSYRYNHPYLSFTGVEALDELKCGYHYELSIEDQLGIVPQPEADFPEEPDLTTGRVSIPKLLEGIASGTQVTDEHNNVVLAVDEKDGTVRLMADIDFMNFNPLDYVKGTGDFRTGTNKFLSGDEGGHGGWTLPNVAGRTFDGNYHSFVNVAFPIFYDISNSRIYNLAIRNSKCEITKENISEIQNIHMVGSNQMTNFGMLGCSVNCLVSDLLLENVSMTVELDKTLAGSTNQTTYNIGCLAGVQNAASSGAANTELRDVELRGPVSVTVNGELSESQDCYIGGLVGQAGAGIDGVSCAQSHGETPEEGKCTLTVKTKSDNTTYAGGLVGLLTGTACNASLATVTDCSQLQASQAYVGGLCGTILNESMANGILTDCNASVAVKGGVAVFVSTLTYSHAYTGGIAGRIKAATCRDIAITGTVEGGIDTEPRTSNTSMFDYATGGAYGIIIDMESESAAKTVVERCSARTKVSAASLETTGMDNWTGNFAGLSNLNETTLREKKNSASENEGLQFVGHVGPEPGGGELTDL